MAYGGEDERYRLDQRIDHVTNETLDATRRIRNVAEETNQIGVDTLVTLNEQGEQLDNVERRVDEINVDLKQTDRNLTELEKCCGCCTCPCGSAPNFKKKKSYRKIYGKKAQEREREEAITEQPSGGYQEYGNGRGRRDQGPYVKRITDDAREDEMEENLQYVTMVSP